MLDCMSVLKSVLVSTCISAAARISHTFKGRAGVGGGMMEEPKMPWAKFARKNNQAQDQVSWLSQ